MTGPLSGWRTILGPYRNTPKLRPSFLMGSSFYNIIFRCLQCYCPCIPVSINFPDNIVGIFGLDEEEGSRSEGQPSAGRYRTICDSRNPHISRRRFSDPAPTSLPTSSNASSSFGSLSSPKIRPYPTSGSDPGSPNSSQKAEYNFTKLISRRPNPTMLQPGCPPLEPI
jgi:hypothetical protein